MVLVLWHSASLPLFSIEEAFPTQNGADGADVALVPTDSRCKHPSSDDIIGSIFVFTCSAFEIQKWQHQLGMELWFQSRRVQTSPLEIK